MYFFSFSFLCNSSGIGFAKLCGVDAKLREGEAAGEGIGELISCSTEGELGDLFHLTCSLCLGDTVGLSEKEKSRRYRERLKNDPGKYE